MRPIVTGIILFSFLTGCAMGPNYKRPPVQTPAQYRQPIPSHEPPEKASLSDLAWANLFHDEVITNLVRTALAQSHDLEAATERVLEARAQHGITRSQLAPQLTASASFTASRLASTGSFNFIPTGANLATT